MLYTKGCSDSIHELIDAVHWNCSSLFLVSQFDPDSGESFNIILGNDGACIGTVGGIAET